MDSQILESINELVLEQDVNNIVYSYLDAFMEDIDIQEHLDVLDGIELIFSDTELSMENKTELTEEAFRRRGPKPKKRTATKKWFNPFRRISKTKLDPTAPRGSSNNKADAEAVSGADIYRSVNGNPPKQGSVRGAFRKIGKSIGEIKIGKGDKAKTISQHRRALNNLPTKLVLKSIRAYRKDKAKELRYLTHNVSKRDLERSLEKPQIAAMQAINNSRNPSPQEQTNPIVRY
jgi:hypothetical protein